MCVYVRVHVCMCPSFRFSHLSRSQKMKEVKKCVCVGGGALPSSILRDDWWFAEEPCARPVNNNP